MSDKFITGIVSLVITLIYYFKGLTIYENISIFLFVYFLITLINSIGKSYDLLVIPILLLIFECLIMPSIVYNIYQEDDFALAFKYNMSVPLFEYYEYLLPATIAMVLGMRIPFMRYSNQTSTIKKAIFSSKKYLTGKSNIGFLLIIFGASSGIISYLVPYELKYIFYLIGMLIVVGVFYIFYSDAKNKKLYLSGALIFIFVRAIAEGIFGDLVYLLLLGGLLIMLGYKSSNVYKFSFAIVGFLFILIIQSIKHEFRNLTWRENKNESDAFFNLVIERIAQPDKFIDKYAMLPTVVRFNQGKIVSSVMDYVPQYEPYAEGETVFNSTLATFIPRFLWPDKPLAGGHQNMLRFTGYKVEGYSMNIGVVGEAYANYGKTGGIIFMFLYGLFFNLIYYFLLIKSKLRPTIVLWIPFIYLNALQAETDILMTVNSTIKNLIFISICFWGSNRFLRINL